MTDTTGLPEALREAVARAIVRADEQNGGPSWDHPVNQNKHVRQSIYDRADAAIAAMEAACLPRSGDGASGEGRPATDAIRQRIIDGLALDVGQFAMTKYCETVKAYLDDNRAIQTAEFMEEAARALDAAATIADRAYAGADNPQDQVICETQAATFRLSASVIRRMAPFAAADGRSRLTVQEAGEG